MKGIFSKQVLLPASAVVILGIIGFIVFFAGGNSPSTTQQTPSGNTNLSDTVVPEKGVRLSEDVAPPITTAPASQVTQSNLREFQITADKGEFSEREIRVYQGDIVKLTVRAVDRLYVIVQPDYGIQINAQKGKTGTAQFGASAAGTYLFYCESCGGPSKGPTGTIVVVPKK